MENSRHTEKRLAAYLMGRRYQQQSKRPAESYPWPQTDQMEEKYEHGGKKSRKEKGPRSNPSIHQLSLPCAAPPNPDSAPNSLSKTKSKNMWTSRAYPLLTALLSHLLYSCPLLTPSPTFPLRNVTAKGIIFHSQPGTASTSPCATTRYEEPYRTRKITDPEERKKEKAKFMQLWMSNRGKEDEQNGMKTAPPLSRHCSSHPSATMGTLHGRLLRECAHRGDNLSNILGHSVPNAFKPVYI
jgi:hypothetical protein